MKNLIYITIIFLLISCQNSKSVGKDIKNKKSGIIIMKTIGEAKIKMNK